MDLEEEAEPERTPENELNKLWQATELDVQAARAPRGKLSGTWSKAQSKGKGKGRKSKEKGLEELWQQEQAEIELHRRREAASGKGFRIYDISGAREQRHLRSYPSKSAECCWKGTIQRDGHGLKILLSSREMDDQCLTHWCQWAHPRLERLPPDSVVRFVDLSRNKITASGLKRLLQTLKDADLPVIGLKLHHNYLNDVAAYELAQYIQYSSYTVCELHLSHNQISELGLKSLLESAVKALQSPHELNDKGHVRYPCERQGRKVPLWIRLHENRVGNGRGAAWVRNFLRAMEHELLPFRRQLCSDPWGFEELKDAMLFCEALEGYGCGHDGCSQTYPELPGLPRGPVVHLPQLELQTKGSSKGSKGLWSSWVPSRAPPVLTAPVRKPAKQVERLKLLDAGGTLSQFGHFYMMTAIIDAV